MTFATVSDRGTTFSGNTQDHPGDMPDHVAGQTLIFVYGFDAVPTVTVDEAVSGTGWDLTVVNHSSGTPKLAVVTKVAESDSEVLELNTGTSEASCNMAWAINAGANPVIVMATAETASANPNPPNLNPGLGAQDYLWLTGFVRDNLSTASAGPADYTQFRTQPGASSGGASMAAAERSLNAASEDPGAFTNGVEQAIMFTIAVLYDDGAPDETAPIIDSLVTAPTSGSLTNLSFNTDEDNGTAYAYVSNNASESVGTIVASGESQTVSTVGAQNFTGLTWTSGQYVHVVHVDTATNESNVLSSLITDALAPVATGPLVVSNMEDTAYRISGFEATDNLAVTGWRWRVDSGSWNTFNDTFFDVTGRTSGETDAIDVEARDAAGNWSNTLSKSVVVGSVEIGIAGIDMRYVSGGSGNNYRLIQTDPPPRGNTTVLWYEWRETQTVYSGGFMFAHSAGFDGGQDVAMFVTHGCPGTFDSDGQRNSGSTTNMFHEIAGMTSAAYGAGNDYIASNSGLVEAGETQQSFPAVYGEWIPRVARIETVSTTITHESYVDWRDKLKVIRQALQTTDIEDEAGLNFYIGAPPWISNGSENFDAKFFFVKQFSRALSDSEIDSEFLNFSDTPVVSDCWFSNIYPKLVGTAMPDMKGFGTAHGFVLDTAAVPTGFHEYFTSSVGSVLLPGNVSTSADVVGDETFVDIAPAAGMLEGDRDLLIAAVTAFSPTAPPNITHLDGVAVGSLVDWVYHGQSGVLQNGDGSLNIHLALFSRVSAGAGSTVQLTSDAAGFWAADRIWFSNAHPSFLGQAPIFGDLPAETTSPVLPALTPTKTKAYLLDWQALGAAVSVTEAAGMTELAENTGNALGTYGKQLEDLSTVGARTYTYGSPGTDAAYVVLELHSMLSEAPPSTFLNARISSAWVPGVLKASISSSWVGVLKRWNGSSWV